jgi:hypothetical protein
MLRKVCGLAGGGEIISEVFFGLRRGLWCVLGKKANGGTEM